LKRKLWGTNPVMVGHPLAPATSKITVREGKEVGKRGRPTERGLNVLSLNLRTT